jgi:subtilisin family serine protease
MKRSSEPLYGKDVEPVDTPLQKEEAFLPELIEVDLLVRAGEARTLFNVDGNGTTVAVLDTGLRTTHVDFAGRVLPGRNFTSDNGGDPADPSDGQGHGTNVSGIICAGDIHTGIAPGAKIVPVKVLGNNGGGSFAGIRDALQWVIDHHAEHGISAVCMSLGDGGNYQDDQSFPGDAIGSRMRTLADLGIVCCVAAGNDYHTHNSVQGMGYPAIFRETVSVGAVYDADEGSFSYQSGAVAFSTAPDRITPFSQRLHPKVGAECATDIFAPGAPVTSSGILNDQGESIQHGTSQATPVVTGVVLLLQALHKRLTGQLPAVADVMRWLEQGSDAIQDGDDEHDNVLHTGLPFRRVDAVLALHACAQDALKCELAAAGCGLRPVEGPRLAAQRPAA